MKALTPEEQYFAKEILKKVPLMLEYEQCTQLETIIEKISR